MSVRSGLAICGVIAALAVAGCGSSGSPSGGGAQPSWAAALGKGVTVIPPGATSPGNDTPADVVAGLVATIKAKNYAGICQYYPPSQQSSCRSSLSGLTAANAPKALTSLTSIKPTYTVIDGDQALVGATGTVCGQSGQCGTNSDPTAVLDSGKPFTQLWLEANASSSNAYAPIPCIKVNGQWYGYTTTSS